MKVITEVPALSLPAQITQEEVVARALRAPSPPGPPQSLSPGSPVPAHVIPNGVVSIAGAGQAAAWAVQALRAQPLLAARAFVARFTLAGAGRG